METIVQTEELTGLSDLIEKQRKRSIQLRIEPLKERKAKLRKLKVWILENRENIQKALFNDYQKPPIETDVSESFVVISEIRNALRNLNSWAKPLKVDTPLPLIGTRSYIQYEPKGVCLIIAPWNYPFNLTIAPLVSAIAAGNTVVLKPSEMTPHTSEMIRNMVNELFTEDEVAVVEGGVEASQALLNQRFDHIFFTGSPRVGKIIMSAAAKNLTSVTLELGGKSPAIVDETASIRDAAQKLVAGKFVNNGQTCIAPDYLLVHEKVRDKLLKAIKDETKISFDPNGEGVVRNKDYGRLVNEAHYGRIRDMIIEEKDKGATIEMGGEFEDDSNFVEPTMISGMSNDSRLLQEEIFGPILPVISYTDLDAELEKINASEKPLALYLFSRKGSTKSKVLKSSSSGTACINECVIHFLNHHLPFGGVNNSGIGKSHGKYGFRAFSNEKGVLKQRVGFTSAKLLSAPYTRFTKLVVDSLLKFF